MQKSKPETTCSSQTLAKLYEHKTKKNYHNAFINSQFSYCPLIWMSHSRTINSLVNNIHERALRIVYKDNTSTFAQLLEKLFINYLFE